MTMMTHRIRTIGISILGGNSGVEGQYELGLDEIKAVNEVSKKINAVQLLLVRSSGAWYHEERPECCSHECVPSLT
jgi:hypothetical protein